MFCFNGSKRDSLVFTELRVQLKQPLAEFTRGLDIMTHTKELYNKLGLNKVVRSFRQVSLS